MPLATRSPAARAYASLRLRSRPAHSEWKVAKVAACLKRMYIYIYIYIYTHMYVYIYMTYREALSPKLLLGIGASKTILNSGKA